MKGEILNSEKKIELYFCLTKISIGYNKGEINFGYGHFTIFKKYYFLFWTLCVMYSVVRFN